MSTSQAGYANVFSVSVSLSHHPIERFCDEVRQSFGWNGAGCNFPCLEISGPFGRFANNVVQLLRSVQLARRYHVPLVHVPLGFIFLNGTYIVEPGTVIYPGGKLFAKGRCLNHTFFFRPEIADLPFLDLRLPDSFKRQYNAELGVEPGGEGDLVIHIRSGDIMPNKAYGSYAQPPCQYYRDIIESRNWSSVQVIAEDVKNPCVSPLNGSAELKIGRPLLQDLRAILGARNLAIGRGTFGFMAVTLSVWIRTLFTFNASTSGLLQETYVKEHMNCIPTDLYFQLLVAVREFKPWQMDLMKTERCTRWENLSISGARKYIHETVI